MSGTTLVEPVVAIPMVPRVHEQEPEQPDRPNVETRTNDPSGPNERAIRPEIKDDLVVLQPLQPRSDWDRMRVYVYSIAQQWFCQGLMVLGALIGIWLTVSGILAYGGVGVPFGLALVWCISASITIGEVIAMGVLLPHALSFGPEFFRRAAFFYYLLSHLCLWLLMIRYSTAGAVGDSNASWEAGMKNPGTIVAGLAEAVFWAVIATIAIYIIGLLLSGLRLWCQGMILSCWSAARGERMGPQETVV